MARSGVLPSCPVSNKQRPPTACPVPTCIDLAELFGKRFRAKYEPSYAAQNGPTARTNDPWLKTIPCRAGHICPWGGSALAAITDKAGPIAHKLALLPGVTVWMDGSDGVTVLFDAACFDEVAKLMKPRRRRRLGPDQLGRLAKAGAKHQFKHGVQNAGKGQIRVATGSVAQRATPETRGDSGVLDAR